MNDHFEVFVSKLNEYIGGRRIVVYLPSTVGSRIAAKQKNVPAGPQNQE
jgi:hypothetical protein